MFQGITTALITPFKSDLSIDFQSLEKLLLFQINSDIDFILLGGSSGEGYNLSRDEYIILVNRALEIVGGRKALIANISSSNSDHSLELLQLFNKTSLYGIISTSPYYALPSQDSIFKYFQKINTISQKPIIIYDHPKRTGVSITDDLLLRLINLENIFALKDSTSDYLRPLRIASRNNTKQFFLLSGNDESFLHYSIPNISGLVSVISNVFPEYITSIYDILKSNDYFLAFNKFRKLYPLIEILKLDVNPVVIKRIAFLQNLISTDNVRFPLSSLTHSSCSIIKQSLKNFTSDENNYSQ